MWLNQWQTHQFNLDFETFDGETEIVIVTDFSAVYEVRVCLSVSSTQLQRAPPSYAARPHPRSLAAGPPRSIQMKQAETEKCSHGTTCNCLVALVLYKPVGSSASDQPKCDVWRIWSPKKGNAAFNQMAMREIGPHYKVPSKVPRLELMKIKSDGQRAQYKGAPNLGAMAEMPHPPVEVNTIDCMCKSGGTMSCGNFMEPGIGIKCSHDFFPSHHGSGAWDSYGKDGPKGMDRDTKFKQSTLRYDYKGCYDWCCKNMAAPSDKKEHRGIFGADGDYIWRAYAETNDGNGFPVIPKDRDFQKIQGSNELYSFHARSAFAPTLEVDFVSCYCEGCRGNSGCLYTRYTRAHVADKTTPEIYTTHMHAPVPANQRQNRSNRSRGGRGAAADDSDGE